MELTDSNIKEQNRQTRLATFQAADDAWSRELVRLFGIAAGDMRYSVRGKGETGSLLRTLHDAREAARVRWEAVR